MHTTLFGLFCRIRVSVPCALETASWTLLSNLDQETKSLFVGNVKDSKGNGSVFLAPKLYVACSDLPSEVWKANVIVYPVPSEHRTGPYLLNEN